MTLEDKATLIASDLENENNFALIDPITIMIIMSILVQVIKLFMKCHSESGAVAQMADPGFFHKLLMRRIIKKEIKKTKFKNRGEEVEEAILKSGRVTTVEEMKDFYNEVRPKYS